MSEKPPEKAREVDIFPIKGQNGRIVTAPLDVLWKENPVKRDRI